MSTQLNGYTHGLPLDAPCGSGAATVSAKARQGKAPDLTGPDLSFVGARFHHVVTYVTREARDEMMPLRAGALT